MCLPELRPGTKQHMLHFRLRNPRIRGIPTTLPSGSVSTNRFTGAMQGVLRKKIHDPIICASFYEEGIDACQGDSGGPMVCEFIGKWYLEGATNWGTGVLHVTIMASSLRCAT